MNAVAYEYNKTLALMESLRYSEKSGLGVSLTAAEVGVLVARLNELENAEAELTELRASLETRSPED